MSDKIAPIKDQELLNSMGIEPITRTKVKEMEELLGLPFPVLDHGFVRVIDYMGDDSAIVQAARVSYGKGTKKLNEDTGLIRYLLRNWHTTPFEMCEIKLHVKMPIFVARQWVRHRTACIAGDQLLHFSSPRALRLSDSEQKNITDGTFHAISIEDFHNMWHGSGKIQKNTKEHYFRDLLEKFHLIEDNKYYTIRELSKKLEVYESRIQGYVSKGIVKSFKNSKNHRQILGVDFKSGIEQESKKIVYKNIEIQDRLKSMNIRYCCEETGEIKHTHVEDIWFSGEKDVYEVEFENGKKIKTTLDHLYKTDQGWKTLKDASQIKIREDKSVSYWINSYQFASNGELAYQNQNWLQNQVDNLLNDQEIGELAGVSKHTIRRWRDKTNIKRTKEQLYAIGPKRLLGTKRNSNHSPTAEHREAIRMARSRDKSNFWKGGICNRTQEKIEYDRKWRQVRNAKLMKENYTCELTGASGGDLEVHHIEPRWMSPDKIFEFKNLMVLNKKIHQLIHKNNLEFKLIDWINQGLDVKNFLNQFEDITLQMSKEKAEIHKKNKTKKHKKLIAHYTRIKSIKYVGKEKTYDLEVSTDDHNFICEGMVVHNSVNEYSGRYSVMDSDFYVPELEHLKPQSQTNKQGRSGQLTDQQKLYVQKLLKEEGKLQYKLYLDLLGMGEDSHEDFPGVARELARMNLGTNFYTQWYWKIDLKNLLHFLFLRDDSHAQWEIQAYAQVLSHIVQLWCPATYQAFQDYQQNGINISQMEKNLLDDLLNSGHDPQDVIDKSDLYAKEYGMSKREIKEFIEKFLD